MANTTVLLSRSKAAVICAEPQQELPKFIVNGCRILLGCVHKSLKFRGMCWPLRVGAKTEAATSKGYDTDMHLRDHFDAGTLQRGQDYARRGLVRSVETLADNTLRARVSNGRGESYQQRISIGNSFVDGICSCPVGHNCKHIVAVLIKWAATSQAAPSPVSRDTQSYAAAQNHTARQLTVPVRGWLTRVQQHATPSIHPETRPEAYPDTIKDRLLFVLNPEDEKLQIDIYKGRMNAAGTSLNQSIKRYDILNAMRSGTAAQFIRPIDLELLPDLAQTELWPLPYSHRLPEELKPVARDVAGTDPPLVRDRTLPAHQCPTFGIELVRRAARRQAGLAHDGRWSSEAGI